jgi:hypothetical protein
MTGSTRPATAATWHPTSRVPATSSSLGDHSLRFAGGGDSAALFGEITDFLSAAPYRREPERVLATILLVRPAGSAGALGLLPTGDQAAGGRPVTGGHGSRGQQASVAASDTVVKDLIRSYRGRPVNGTGQAGVLAAFDAPGQAIRCAAAVRDQAAACGIQLAFGIHTGEVEVAGHGVGGASVRIAASVAALAEPAEILVYRTVKDLLAGSGLSFSARGSQELTEAGEKWPLFAVALPQG